MNKETLLVVVSIVVALLALGAANATGNDPVNPGPLHQDHVDTNCSDCHTPWKGTTDQKCLDCHEDVDTKGTENYTLHKDYTASCSTCHHDHGGRNMDLTDSTEPVDHDVFDQNRSCTDCHQDDVERSFPKSGHFEFDCQECHNTQNWGEVSFDHSEFFNLRSEGHWRTSCEDCHPDNLKETTCSTPGCHRDGTFQQWKDFKEGRSTGGGVGEPGEGFEGEEGFDD